MDWKKSEEMLTELSLAYNTDNIRKITYNKEIFPLSFRFYSGERTTELYDSISGIHQQLLGEIFLQVNISKWEEGYEYNAIRNSIYNSCLYRHVNGDGLLFSKVFNKYVSSNSAPK